MIQQYPFTLSTTLFRRSEWTFEEEDPHSVLNTQKLYNLFWESERTLEKWNPWSVKEILPKVMLQIPRKNLRKPNKKIQNGTLSIICERCENPSYFRRFRVSSVSVHTQNPINTNGYAFAVFNDFYRQTISFMWLFGLPCIDLRCFY